MVPAFDRLEDIDGKRRKDWLSLIFVAFVEDKATMISIEYFENHVSYFVQNRRK